MFTIIREDEPIPFTKSLVVVLFGEPGMGKTSLSFTADSPLVMDFDDGVRRAVGRKATIRFESWQDVLDFMDSTTLKEEQIRTLIVDTAGTMLDDYLAQHIMKMDPKYGNGAGGLGLKGYGIMKDSFARFLISGSKAGVESFIFVCHTAEKDDGDATRLKPKVTGGSYDVLISKADLVGYLEMKNNQASLDFNPTTRHIGKNCAEFKAMPVPSYTTPDYATFMAKILAATREKIQKSSEAQAAAVKTVNDLKDTIEGCTTIAELDALAPKIQALSTTYKIQVQTAHDQHYAKLFADTMLDQEKVKTLDDFEAVSALIQDLPYNVQQLLRPAIAELMKVHGVAYDKAAKKFVKPLDKPEPAGQLPLTA